MPASSVHQGTDQRSGRMRQVQWSTTEEGQSTWRGRVGGGAPHSYGHLSVISTYNPIYRMYNPIYNHL